MKPDDEKSDDKHGVCEHCGGLVGEDGMAESDDEVKISPNSEDESTDKSDLFAAAVKRSRR